MRTFSSYGPVSKNNNFYVPRTKLIDKTKKYLVGTSTGSATENMEGGHYITVWASRQAGKTWTLIQILWDINKENIYHAVKLELQHLETITDISDVVRIISREIIETLKLDIEPVNSLDEFQFFFKKENFDKPLILILDEFDSLHENIIANLVQIFRNIHILRKKDRKPAFEKDYLLHGIALIGVRSVVGVENKKGSPFNVQKSVHIPNLTYDEVNEMYQCYIKESGRIIEQDVIDRVYYITKGQPGLVSWFGELLTEPAGILNPINLGIGEKDNITMKEWNSVYSTAISLLPNNNIINIISKAKQDPYRELVLEVFKTSKKLAFEFEDPEINFLYMNGVITNEKIDNKEYIKFPSPFVQEKLFRRFMNDIFPNKGRVLTNPFTDLNEIITDSFIDIKELMKLYQIYIDANKEWLFKNVPRRTDNRIFEAVFHFNLFAWLQDFMQTWPKTHVFPEFPTGNGKIDLIIRTAPQPPKGGVLVKKSPSEDLPFRGLEGLDLGAGNTYGLELKSFKNFTETENSVVQAAEYGKSLGLNIMYLITFIEFDIPEDRKEGMFKHVIDESTGVEVVPIYINV